MNDRRWTTLLAAIILGCWGTMPALAAEDLQVRVVPRPSTELHSPGYVFNRAPLEPQALTRLPIGAITPRGWLRKQLELQAEGMHGHLSEISPFLEWEGNGWVDPQCRGGWEEVPYWIKGYGDLGYVLHDERILAESRRWLEAILATQQSDGWFGPAGLRTSLEDKPDMWPHMPVLNALQSYYEYSGDARVLEFLLNYSRWQNAQPREVLANGYWPRVRFGDNLETLYWLYNRTGETWLLELAAKIFEAMSDWNNHIPSWHNVNIAEGFRAPATYWLQGHEPRLLESAEHNYQEVMGVYGQFPGGGFAGDENCRPGCIDPRQAFETCGVVEFIHSFQMLTRISSNPLWADRCEEIAFNTLPATMTPDWKGLHYLTGANMVQLDRCNKSPGVEDRGTMLAYSPRLYRCCQHNHGMGWPYYAEELWLATADGGLCASLYAASEVKAKVADGVEIGIAEETDYPFAETIALRLTTPQAVRFPLYLRVPRWCRQAKLKLNGQSIEVKAEPLSYLVVERTWKDGDRVSLELPMEVSVRTWAANQNSVSVDRGPLTFSTKIGEKWTPYGDNAQWPDWEVFPTTPWNYGLVLEADDPAKSFQVVRQSGPLASQPFVPDAVPVALRVKAKKIPAWQLDRYGLAAVLQPSPVRSDEPEETITLIPMGAARLRITSFPTIGSGPTATTWVEPEKAPPLAYTPIASHVGGSDSEEALADGIEPANSNDHGIPRMTWWDHRGTQEWAEADFATPRTLSEVSVYWFDDTPDNGSCRAPESWRLLYRDGNAWKPVEGASEFGTKLDGYNRISFSPVTTTALRLEVQLQANYSGGILEWKLGPSAK